jgi:hypothetical protein
VVLRTGEGQRGTSTAIEGCLSVPRGDWKIEVTRSETVTVRYLASDGLQETLTASGAVARQIQHEIDHLDGILVTDYAKRAHFNSKLVVAVAIYLLALTVAVGLYMRNRVKNRRRTSSALRPKADLQQVFAMPPPPR